MTVKRLSFDYRMEVAYETQVQECCFTLKCFPRDTARQEIKGVNLEIVPAARWEHGMDSFGNRFAFGRVDTPHQAFSVHLTGEADVGLAQWEREGAGPLLGAYRCPHGLTCPGAGLTAYHAAISSAQRAPALLRSEKLMHRLHQDFSYLPHTTSLSTTAEEAWQKGHGVCQDYAHILTALCRLDGIPARYVTGLLTGEGFSHAWVEVFSEGKWYGLDPTNDVPVTDAHIRLGAGRDAGDCQINRGLLRGGGCQRQAVRVTVKELSP